MNTVLPQAGQSGFYRLDQSGGTGVQGRNSRASLAAAIRTHNASAVLPTNAGTSAYHLDLSPEAQKYLTQVNSTQEIAQSTPQGFILHSQQLSKIQDILERFAGADYTQDTFDAIQVALQEEGLGPNQLAARYRASSFNSTASLIDALAGGKGKIPGSQPVGDEELSQRSDQYISYIASQWQQLRDARGEQPDDSGSESASGSEENADAVSAVSDSGSGA